MSRVCFDTLFCREKMFSNSGMSVSFHRPAPVFTTEERPLSTKKVSKAKGAIKPANHRDIDRKTLNRRQ